MVRWIRKFNYFPFKKCKISDEKYCERGREENTKMQVSMLVNYPEIRRWKNYSW